MSKRENVFRFRGGLWALLLALLLAIIPLQAFAEGALPEQEQLVTAEVELYHCGGLPREGLRSRAYGLDELESYLLSQLNNTASEINLRDYALDYPTFKQIYQNLLNAHPEMFFVEGKYSYGSNGSIVTRLLPSYKYTGDELRTRQSQFNAELNRIVSYASSAGTTLGKLLRLNDYFCLNYQYDLNYSYYAPDELFIYKTGVCQAYMLGMRAALNRMGIPADTATSSAMNHTWNMVRVDGSWYHIDVTWNDPTPDMPLRVCHDNFLLSDSGIRSEGHYDWTSAQTATNTQYDGFFWQNVKTPMPVQGNDVYYAQMDTSEWILTLYRWTIGGGTTAIYSTDGRRNIGGFNPVQLVNGQLCFALSGELHLLDAEAQTDSIVYAMSSSSYIFSSLYENGQMQIVAGNDYASKKLMTVELTLPPRVTLDAEKLLVRPGEQATLTATVENAPDQPVQWQSADPTIATVDDAGLITGVKPGVVEITASCAGATARCQVLVYQFAVEAQPGEPLAQGYTFTPNVVGEPAEVGADGWRFVSSEPSIVRANEDGTLTTLDGGKAQLTGQSIRYPSVTVECAVSVVHLPVMTLPADLTRVEAEAFAGASCARVEAGAALERIGARAFADCTALRLVSLGEGVQEIAADAFDGCDAALVFLCPAGSAAAAFAQAHGWTWVDSGN